MVEVLLVTLLVAISALIGVLITYFTRTELKVYKNHIARFRLLILAILILTTVFFGFYSLLSIAGLFAGVIVGFVLRNQKSLFNEWLWLGILIGSSFAVDRTVGLIVASLVAIYNMILAGYVNIPAVIKRVSESKARVIEQIVFIAGSIVTYAALSSHGAAVSSVAVYVAAAALIWVFVREVFLIK